MSTFPTDAEREAVDTAFGYVPEPEPLENMLAVVGRIVAAREAAAEKRVENAALRAKVARVEAEHRQDWADYIESWQSAVGVLAPTPAAIVEALRKPRPPFGRAAALKGDPWLRDRADELEAGEGRG